MERVDGREGGGEGHGRSSGRQRSELLFVRLVVLTCCRACIVFLALGSTILPGGHELWKVKERAVPPQGVPVRQMNLMLYPSAHFFLGCAALDAFEGVFGGLAVRERPEATERIGAETTAENTIIPDEPRKREVHSCDCNARDVRGQVLRCSHGTVDERNGDI